MLVENAKSSIKYYQIVCVLRLLLAKKLITLEEYAKAKQYYQGITCSDLIIIDHHEAG